MNKNYPNMFKPFRLKNLELRNRIVMMPMGTNYGEQTGEMSFVHINYYEMRARGGVGMIIVENVCVDYPLGSNGTTQLRLDHDSFIPRLSYLCDSVHKHEAKIAVQLNHAGASAVSQRIGSVPVSSSYIPTKEGGSRPRPLTHEEIEDIVRKYGEAALRAKIAGFDAVEIHCGHSYLISQFLSPLYNKRTDEYGGSLENRARFARMVIEEVRRQVGDDFPILLRLSADEMIEGGNDLQASIEQMHYFVDQGDILDVSCGLNDSIQYQIDSAYREDGWRSYMASEVKKAFGKPVIAMGNMRSPKVIEDILSEGEIDLIGMGRGLIADPDWVNKVRYNKEETIRKCISCNVGCAGNRIGTNRPIRCSVNPTVNQNEDYMKHKIKKDCNVIVIGGGTAGLEAACTTAEVGCHTILFEKSNELGGLVRFISHIPEKKRMMDFVDYLEYRATHLKNLYIFKNFDVTIDQLKQLHPDIIVNATGSVPLLPDIKGLHEQLDKKNVDSIETMINHIINNEYPDNFNHQKIVVIGGGAVGIDVVDYFANRDGDCSVVEMQSEIGKDLDPVSKCDMKTHFKEHHVQQYTDTKLLEVKDHSFIVEHDKKQQELFFDYGFVCLGMKPNQPLLADLRNEFPDEETEIYNIGDSVRARRIIDGIRGGHDILEVLKRRGFYDEY